MQQSEEITLRNKLDKSLDFQLPQEFYELVQHGVIPLVKQEDSCIYTGDMSASVIIHLYNHSKFLKMLFQSFEQLDMENIDTEFIITDSGSDDENVQIVKDLIDKYNGTLKIKYLWNDLSEQRKKFESEHKDIPFHGFNRISNVALNHIQNDIYCLCDSSNIVAREWLRTLISPHYTHRDKTLITKVLGADFTTGSTILINKKRDRDYSPNYFKLHHTRNDGYSAGSGTGISFKNEIAKKVRFNNYLSSVGTDDDFTYRFLQYAGSKGLFLGNNFENRVLAIHRKHFEGYDEEKGERKRNPGWAYKTLHKWYVKKIDTPPVCALNVDEDVPKFIYSNF